MIAADAASRSRAPPRRGLDGRVALVDLMHRQTEAPAQLAREALGALRVFVRRAVRMARNADDERVGLPVLDQRADRSEA